MFTNTTAGIGNALLSMFRTEKSETPLVKMFRVEYGREYRNARKYGATVNDQYVNEFIKNTRT